MAELERVTVDDLRRVLAEVDEKRPTERLMAVINYVEEDNASMAEVAERYGYSPGWVSQWMDRLERLADEPFEAVVYDDHRSGRPTKLTEDQHEQFVQALNEPPEEAGLDAPAWSVPLAEQYLQEEFDVTFCRRHVRRLMTEAGLSWKTARPSYVDSDERAQEAFRDGFKKSSES
jgi:transposase